MCKEEDGISPDGRKNWKTSPWTASCPKALRENKTNLQQNNVHKHLEERKSNLIFTGVVNLLLEATLEIDSIDWNLQFFTIQ